MLMLKQTAQENGYNKEICGFLGVLEARFKLQGVGCIHVEKALEKQIPEHAIIKVALANIGNVFPAETGDKPESAFTTEDIIAEGEEEYKKHLIPLLTCSDLDVVKSELKKRLN